MEEERKEEEKGRKRGREIDEKRRKVECRIWKGGKQGERTMKKAGEGETIWK